MGKFLFIEDYGLRSWYSFFIVGVVNLGMVSIVFDEFSGIFLGFRRYRYVKFFMIRVTSGVFMWFGSFMFLFWAYSSFKGGEFSGGENLVF